MSDQSQATGDLHKEIDRIAASGGLGRSTVYLRLLRYLADAALQGKSLKELDVAADVLRKHDYDPSSDAGVRVYMHNLRQKLEEFYAADGGHRSHRLLVPKGKYEVTLTPLHSASPAVRYVQLRYRLTIAFVAALLLFATFTAGRQFATPSEASADPLQDTPVWSAILDDHEPIVIVVGDYFMYAEGNQKSPGGRLIRDFAINNSEDFNAWMQANPDLSDDYMNIRLSYLPVGIAPALADLIRVLDLAQRRYYVIPQSEFWVPMLRNNHVIYLGYVSGMGMLAQYVFDVSRLRVGYSYDELVDRETGIVYESSAGLVTDADEAYSDYSLISTFPGPAGRQILVVAGLRDEGLMQAASIVSDPVTARPLGATVVDESAKSAFEALFRVSGFDRTYVGAYKEFEASIDASNIWTTQ